MRNEPTSQFRGVYLNKRDGCYRAKIAVRGVTIHLGDFGQDELAAARAYNAAALKHHGAQFAVLNIFHEEQGETESGNN
jgi:hypothetical protein